MFMLNRCSFAPHLFQMASIDVATNGSETNMLKNVQEAANILDPWEMVYSSSIRNLEKYKYEIDQETAEAVLKELYQSIRHGLSFDWPMNYVVGLLSNYYPFSHHAEFSQTKDFINEFKDDPVFTRALDDLKAGIDKVLDWVFEGYEERTVYRRLAEYAKTEDLARAILYVEENPPEVPFTFPVKTLARAGYLVLLMDMLTLAIGRVKRQYWTDRFFAIRSGELEDYVIVTGGAYTAYAYGNLGDGVKWHKLRLGIKMLDLSQRVQKQDYIRVFPDEMTFFQIRSETLFLDETHFPKVSFDNGQTWAGPVNFSAVSIEYPMDVPLRMLIKYDFPQNPNKPKQIKLTAKLNCLAKDSVLTLNEQGIAESQIVFRSNKIGFKIADPDKLYPFGIFSSKKIVNTGFPWLEGTAEENPSLPDIETTDAEDIDSEELE